MGIIKKFPTFEVHFTTNTNTYEIVYDTKYQFNNANYVNALISFTLMNDMSSDTPVFSLVMVSNTKWDQILNSNDLVQIKVNPDETRDAPQNPYIMVGMISDIHKEGEYASGQLLYRITGQAMSKVLMSFSVGVIQEVAAVIPTVGWLIEDPANGLQFTLNTASGIATELWNRFIWDDKTGAKFAKYTWGQKGVGDYFIHDFTSWVNDEALKDASPYINYQGTMRQFLQDVSATPFNELFFEYTKDGRCVAIMRPTPFDEDKWTDLPFAQITSDFVLQESFGKNDTEAYSVYVVAAPNITDLNALQLGVHPKTNPVLIDKYGYKRLDAQNQYLIASGMDASANATAGSGASNGDNSNLPPFNAVDTFLKKNGITQAELKKDPIGNKAMAFDTLHSQFSTMSTIFINKITEAVLEGNFTDAMYNNWVTEATLGTINNTYPTYDVLMKFITSSKLDDKETLRKNPAQVYGAIQAQYPVFTNYALNSIVQALQKGNFTSDVYDQINSNTSGDTNNGGTSVKQPDLNLLDTYTTRLYNWYCENVNFYAGEIRVIGHPDYRVGSKLLYTDYEENTIWEFYIESVEHDFDYLSGYTTILGVTRGLQSGDLTTPKNKRFTNLYGQSVDFDGGYMGEPKELYLFQEGLAALALPATDQSNFDPNGNSNSSSNDPTNAAGVTPGNADGGPSAMGALFTAQEATKRTATYKFGAGRNGNPLYKSPIVADCSSFVWWCYDSAGIRLGGSSPGNTDSIAKDSRLQVIGNRGDDRDLVLTKIKKGDLVYFDTYKADGHIGIYAGNGHYIAIQEGHKGHDIQSYRMYDTNGDWIRNSSGSGPFSGNDMFNGHVLRFNDKWT